MIREPQILRDFLATHPEAWPVRMALIEELVRDGKNEEARLVIRESPPGNQMPGDYQHRIHIALTKGAAGLNSLPSLPGFEERPAAKPKTAPSNPKPLEASPPATAPTLDKNAANLDEPKAGKPGVPTNVELDILTPGSRALTESAAMEHIKPQLTDRSRNRDNTVGSDPPMMKVASIGKPPLSTGEGVAPGTTRSPLAARVRFYDSATELSRFAIVFVITLFLSGTILLSRTPSMMRQPWETRNGDLVEATAVEFDLKTKMVTLENREKVRIAYSTEDLDFTSKRRLFFSSAFQKTQLLDGVANWSPEKIKSYTLLVSIFILLFISGMWVAGLVIAKRRNPFVAAIACGLAWLTGSILMATYFLIDQRIAAEGVMWFGAALSMAVAALVVSALYLISYFRGLLIFVSHVALAGILIYFLVFQADTVFPTSTRQFWNQEVFVPTGLVD